MSTLAERKQSHLDICLDRDSGIETCKSGFDNISLYHNPMPELNSSNINLETEFLNYRLKLPLIISSMTGGSDEGRRLNRLLARSAQKNGLAIGTGSIRVMLRYPETRSHFYLKELAPDVPVLGNIGAAQLTQYSPSELIDAVARIEADGLFVHLNPAQELFQADGDRDFTRWYEGLGRLIEKASFPVLVKETGFGIPPFVGIKILEMGAAYVDIAGQGGTNWVAVEAHGLPPEKKMAADSFSAWGYDTAALLVAYREFITSSGSLGWDNRGINIAELVKDRIIASGGLRSPMDFAISLACGAWLGGTALPLIRLAADGGEEAVSDYIAEIETGIRNSMLLTSCDNLSQFRKSPLRIKDYFMSEAKKINEVKYVTAGVS